MNKEEIEKFRKAGEIAIKVREYIKPYIKKEILLIYIAEKIESKIIELGGKPAFPTNLSINEIAAHFTPLPNDTTKAEGLLKIDFGVSVEGYIADTAFSVDLDNKNENRSLISTADACLKAAINQAKKEPFLNKIGANIQKIAESAGFSPIQNLTGHQIERFDLHAGLTIPNYDNESIIPLDDGVYAIEPFVTSGRGLVYEGKPSGIYRVNKNNPVRDEKTREIFNFIIEEYQGLPFCSRWIVKKFGARALFSLNLLEQVGNIKQYPQLIERSKKPVAQAEHTIMIVDGNVEITTN